MLNWIGNDQSMKMRETSRAADKKLQVNNYLDTSVYDALVNMSQDFNERYPLVSFQGNNGSLDKDAAAAYRYTEAKLSNIGYAMLDNIEKETVPFVPNYCNTTVEPTVLSGYIPNLLLNGSSGIAVGMACNMPPHNMTEIYEGLNYIIDQTINEEDIEESDLFNKIKGPDFPLGGKIIGTDGILDYFRTGTGKMTIQSSYEIENKKDKTYIIFKDIPYKYSKAEIVTQIEDLRKANYIDIKEVRDESDIDHLVRIVLELKKNANADLIIKRLYQKTGLQTSYTVNNTVLIDGKPEVVNLIQMLSAYLSHIVDVTINRIMFDARKANNRLNIVNGLLITINNIETVMPILKDSINPEEDLRNTGLYENDAQIEAVVAMTLRNITKSYYNKYIDEKDKLEQEIADYNVLLSDNRSLLTFIKNEFNKINEKYGDKRRTEIVYDYKDVEIIDLIEIKNLVISYTQNNIIKAVDEQEYKAQRRNGKGLSNLKSDSDAVKTILTLNNKTKLMFFTNMGRCHIIETYKLPIVSRTAKGKHINNYLSLLPGEIPVNMYPLDLNAENKFIFMVTKDSMIKKFAVSSLSKRGGASKIIGFKNEKDYLVDAIIVNENDYASLITATGKALLINLSKIRTQTGKAACGVTSMKVEKNDRIIQCVSFNSPDSYLITVTENGYCKKTNIADYSVKGKNGFGAKTHTINEETGKLICAVSALGDGDIFASTCNGQIIRTNLKNIRETGRVSVGTRLIKLEDGDRIASVSVTNIEYENNNEEDQQEKALAEETVEVSA